MKPNDDKISSFQLGVFCVLSIISAALLTMPSLMVQKVANDAWILCIVDGVITFIPIFLICNIIKKHGELGFVGTLKYLFGKFFGSVLAIPVIIYALCIVALQLRIFSEAAKLFLLYKTPLEFIIIPMLLVNVLLVRRGIEPIVRFFELNFFVLVFFAIIAFFVVLPDSDISNLRPYFTHSLDDYAKAIPASIFSYLGFEAVLAISPNIRKRNKTFKVLSISMISIILIYTISVIICIARFGSEETKALLYPLLSLIDASAIPGGFIERIEGFLMIMWMIAVFTTLVSYSYFFSITCTDILKQKNPRHITMIMVPIVYILSLQGESIVKVFKIYDMVALYLGTYTVLILPLLMYIVSLVRDRGGKKDEA